MNLRYILSTISVMVVLTLISGCDSGNGGEQGSDVFTITASGETTLADGASTRSLQVAVTAGGEAVRSVHLFANGGQLLDVRTGTAGDDERELRVVAREAADKSDDSLYVEVLLKSQRGLETIEVVAELPDNPEFSADVQVPFEPVRFLGHVVRDIQDEDGSSYAVAGTDGQPALMLPPSIDTTGIPLVFVLNTARARPGGTLNLETSAGVFAATSSASTDSVGAAMTVPQSGIVTVRLKDADASTGTSAPRTLYAEINGFRGSFPMQFR